MSKDAKPEQTDVVPAPRIPDLVSVKPLAKRLGVVWGHYWARPEAKRLLRDLARQAKCEPDDLYKSDREHGTRVHPDLAQDFERWAAGRRRT